jgi:hypothetical protein
MNTNKNQSDDEVYKQYEILRILAAFPEGLSREDIFAKADSFESAGEMGRTIGRLLQQVAIIRLGSNHFALVENEGLAKKKYSSMYPEENDSENARPSKTELTERLNTAITQPIKNWNIPTPVTTPPPVTQRPDCMPALTVKEIERTPSPQSKAPMGHLQPRAVTGRVALAVYENALDNSFLVSQIEKFCPNISKTDVARVLSQLSYPPNNYFTVIGSRTTRKYQWSGVFSYPFANKLKDEHVKLPGPPVITAIRKFGEITPEFKENVSFQHVLKAISKLEVPETKISTTNVESGTGTSPLLDPLRENLAKTHEQMLDEMYTVTDEALPPYVEFRASLCTTGELTIESERTKIKIMPEHVAQLAKLLHNY